MHFAGGKNKNSQLSHSHHIENLWRDITENPRLVKTTPEKKFRAQCVPLSTKELTHKSTVEKIRFYHRAILKKEVDRGATLGTLSVAYSFNKKLGCSGPKCVGNYIK